MRPGRSAAIGAPIGAAMAAAMAAVMAAVMAAAMALAFAVGPTLAQAQSVTTAGPATNPIRDGTPRFTITTEGFGAADLPLQLRLQVSLTSDFAGPFWADTTVGGSDATIVIPRLLPQQANVWWRTVVRTARGTSVVENASGPLRSSPWVVLISPNNLNGTTVTSTRPVFTWSAVRLHQPVAPWRFNVQISRSSDGLVVLNSTQFDMDTTFTPPTPLESNTSYRWAVSAVAGTGDSVRVVNASSFVISSPNAPIATVLFQPFPTPFPTERLSATCIWFDLRRQSDITLEVLDLRGNRVARILPGRGLGGTLPPGRYGRVAFGSDSGCDERLSWNGTDDAGRLVKPGVYLVKFTGDGEQTIKKVLFKGRN
jgi:hypothetical protein